MEGAHFAATGELLSLSESNFVDCSWANHGCNGGIMDNAFKYAETHPIETEDDYPYHANTSLWACKYDKSKGKVKVISYSDVESGNEKQMMAAVAKGPVSVAIEADQYAFQMYKNGVLAAKDCGENLDHGVLVVGYGTENEVDYWLVKNSWSAKWGDNGYIKLERNSKNGACGVQMMASQPQTN